MTVHYYRHDDTGAPDIIDQGVKGVTNLIKIILTTGYGSHPAPGWTIVYDDAANNGDLILKNTRGDHFVLWPAGGDTLETGMCANADGTGAKTTYKSGTFAQGSGRRQRLDLYSGYVNNWYAFYDDVSETLTIRVLDDGPDDWNSYRNSSGWTRQMGLYMGTLKPPVSGAYAPAVIFCGTYDTRNYNNLFTADDYAQYGPTNGHSGTILKPYADEVLAGAETAFVPIALNDESADLSSTSTAPPYIGLQPANVYMHRSGSWPGLEFIGSIRGHYLFPAIFSPKQNAADTFARWIDPACSGYPSMVINPLRPGDGFNYYTTGGRTFQYGIHSDNPDWW